MDDRVVVEPVEAESTTAGGIVLPDSAQEKPQRGTVVAVGPGKLLDSGNRGELSVDVGVAGLHRLLARLPEGAFLFNVARGEHLVETDLLEALDRRHLSGALLDVFIEEPLPASHPFWQHPRVLVTPHIAAPSGAKASAEQVVDSLIKLEAGDMPGGLVERDRGY